jgi:hypothetical protein
MSPSERAAYSAEIDAAMKAEDRERLATAVGRFAREVAEGLASGFPAGTDLEGAIQEATLSALAWIGECNFNRSDLHVWVWKTVRMSLFNSARAQRRWRRKHSQMPEAD